MTAHIFEYSHVVNVSDTDFGNVFKATRQADALENARFAALKSLGYSNIKEFEKEGRHALAILSHSYQHHEFEVVDSEYSIKTVFRTRGQKLLIFKQQIESKKGLIATCDCMMGFSSRKHGELVPFDDVIYAKLKEYSTKNLTNPFEDA